jgi:hypothetical protein
MIGAGPFGLGMIEMMDPPPSRTGLLTAVSFGPKEWLAIDTEAVLAELIVGSFGANRKIPST